MSRKRPGEFDEPAAPYKQARTQQAVDAEALLRSISALAGFVPPSFAPTEPSNSYSYSQPPQNGFVPAPPSGPRQATHDPRRPGYRPPEPTQASSSAPVPRPVARGGFDYSNFDINDPNPAPPSLPGHFGSHPNDRFAGGSSNNGGQPNGGSVPQGHFGSRPGDRGHFNDYSGPPRGSFNGDGPPQFQRAPPRGGFGGAPRGGGGFGRGGGPRGPMGGGPEPGRIDFFTIAGNSPPEPSWDFRCLRNMLSFAERVDGHRHHFEDLVPEWMRTGNPLNPTVLHLPLHKAPDPRRLPPLVPVVRPPDFRPNFALYRQEEALRFMYQDPSLTFNHLIDALNKPVLKPVLEGFGRVAILRRDLLTSFTAPNDQSLQGRPNVFEMLLARLAERDPNTVNSADYQRVERYARDIQSAIIDFKP